MIWSFVIFVLMSAVTAGCTTNCPLGTIDIPWTLNQLKWLFLQLVHWTHCTSLNSNKCNRRKIWNLMNPKCLLDLAELLPGSALINMEGLHTSVVRAVWVSLPPGCSCLIQTFGCGSASPLPPSLPSMHAIMFLPVARLSCRCGGCHASHVFLQSVLFLGLFTGVCETQVLLLWWHLK